MDLHWLHHEWCFYWWSGKPISLEGLHRFLPWRVHTSRCCSGRQGNSKRHRCGKSHCNRHWTGTRVRLGSIGRSNPGLKEGDQTLSHHFERNLWVYSNSFFSISPWMSPLWHRRRQRVWLASILGSMWSKCGRTPWSSRQLLHSLLHYIFLLFSRFATLATLAVWTLWSHRRSSPVVFEFSWQMECQCLLVLDYRSNWLVFQRTALCNCLRLIAIISDSLGLDLPPHSLLACLIPAQAGSLEELKPPPVWSCLSF